MSAPERSGGSAARAANDALGERIRQMLQRTTVHRGAGRMVILLIAAFALFAVLNPRVFLGPVNLQNIMVASPEVGVLAIAMMLAMLTGGIDLSLVSIANLSAISVATVFLAVEAIDPAAAESMTLPLVLLGVAVGVACGVLNGVLVSVVGITPILATLGTMQILNGIAIVWTGGSTLYGSPAALTAFGRAALGPVPALFVVLIVVAVAVGLLVTATPLGRKIQLQGANPVAARYSGIANRRVLLSTYMLTGALAGVAGVLFIARNPTASADYGASYVLLIIVIAVLGGTNPSGGFATVTGVVLATLTLQIVSSGFTALRLSPYEYSIAQGAILIAVMVFDSISWRRRRRPASPPGGPPPPEPANRQQQTPEPLTQKLE